MSILFTFTALRRGAAVYTATMRRDYTSPMVITWAFAMAGRHNADAFRLEFDGNAARVTVGVTLSARARKLARTVDVRYRKNMMPSARQIAKATTLFGSGDVRIEP